MFLISGVTPWLRLVAAIGEFNLLLSGDADTTALAVVSVLHRSERGGSKTKFRHLV